MNKQQMLAIFSNMDTGRMIDALSAVGITTEPTERDYLGAENRSSLEPYSARKVQVPLVKKPELIDKSQLFVQEPAMARQRPSYLDPESPEGYEDYAMHSGMYG